MEVGACGAAHGLEPDTQICPTAAFPLEIPFTNHVTVASPVFVSAAANDFRVITSNVADEGDTFTLILLTSVTDAAAIVAPFVAWIATVLVEGRAGGAE